MSNNRGTTTIVAPKAPPTSVKPVITNSSTDALPAKKMSDSPAILPTFQKDNAVSPTVIVHQ